ncbi:MAG: flagellar brake protein [Syntrophomonadaceae bacterium]
MRGKGLKINQLIHVEIEDQEGHVDRLPSRIEGISGKHLCIAMPTRHGVLVPLKLGQTATIIISDRSGMLSATTKVLGRQREPIPVVFVELPEEFDSVAQRREFVRLEISLPVWFSIVGKAPEGACEPGTTIDLSAGGVCFISRLKLEAGQMLGLCLNFGDGEFSCKAQVVRCRRTEVGSLNYTVAVKFIEITDNLRDHIVGFVFAKQREWIKKGLL